MTYVYENTDNYNPSRKTLIVFDDMIADIMTNKKFQAIIKELFIRCRNFCSKRREIKFNPLFDYSLY